MKYLLSRSKQLILVIISVGFLITLSFSNLVESYRKVDIPANGLTNNYYAFSIGENRDKITRDNITLKDMLAFLKEQKAECVLLKESDSNIFGVYQTNDKFKPNIIEGRTFSNDDFENKTNTIIISEGLKNRCVKKDGKIFYQFDANYFEVIGVYKPSNNTINPDALAYYNLCSEKLISKNPIYDNYIFGRYQLDAGIKTEALTRLLNDYCQINISRSIIDNNFSEKLKKTISSQGITLFPILLIIFLILLNSINICSSWIENRKREIFIRRMVGATDKRISIMLIKELVMIITLNYIPVLLLEMIISRIDLVIFLNFKFSIVTVIGSYLLIMLVGLISAGMMLITYYKNSISQIRG